MTAKEAELVYGIIAGGQFFTRKDAEVWVAVVCSPQQSDVSFDDLRSAAFQLLAEFDPRKIHVAMVLQKARGIAKTRDPSTVEQWDTDAKLALEAPRDMVNPLSTGPAARGHRWAKRHKVKGELEPNLQRRAELAEMLSNLGARMKFRCIKCAGEFTRVDVEAYVLRLMDAGRNDDPEPPRWCAHCTPTTTREEHDDEVPF